MKCAGLCNYGVVDFIGFIVYYVGVCFWLWFIKCESMLFVR